MHELSIALSMIEMATEEAARHGSSSVSAVHLKLGQLSGVVKEALLFSWDLACESTPLEGSKLLIEEIPAAVYCSNCLAERILSSIQHFVCPVCETPSSNVVHGNEIEVVGLEIQV